MRWLTGVERTDGQAGGAGACCQTGPWPSQCAVCLRALMSAWGALGEAG